MTAAKKTPAAVIVADEPTHESDPWIMAQRWGRAIAKAQAGEPHELAHMVVYEGPPPSGLRKDVFVVLENPAPVRRDGRKVKVPDHLAQYIRYVVQRDRKAKKPAQVTEDELHNQFGISVRTIRDIATERNAYARRAWRMKPVAKR